ncbi:KPN_02809 family neutral zinc metallopeptidase [Corynebacterium sp. A21]|uniref:KPN_02809 family neutral zinc metallopeptidase n=1 Tax=Corynebacterium sp. A21 TaxID=3457318 RepID=UPI003FD586FE
MTFRGDVSKSGARARTGGGGRGGMIAGGGIGSLLLVGLFLLLGGDPGDINNALGTQNQEQLEPGAGTGTLDHCQTAEDANTMADCRVEFTAISVDQVWQEQLPAQAGIEYSEPGLIIFEQSTNSGCGFASASTGPFYCPTDQTAFFDVSFFEQLEQLGGENAPLAQMYIVAHEIGHHIQNLEGTLGLSDYNDPGVESNAVKIEVQADCYGGLWAHYADDGSEGMLETITPEQVADALAAAGAVGDDNIQQRSGGDVSPESWTHGSSEQRQQAFLTGYETGSMAACDTLERGVYR